MKKIALIIAGMVLLMAIGVALLYLNTLIFVGLWLICFAPLLAILAMIIVRYL